MKAVELRSRFIFEPKIIQKLKVDFGEFNINFEESWLYLLIKSIFIERLCNLSLDHQNLILFKQLFLNLWLLFQESWFDFNCFLSSFLIPAEIRSLEVQIHTFLKIGSWSFMLTEFSNDSHQSSDCGHL